MKVLTEGPSTGKRGKGGPLVPDLRKCNIEVADRS